MHVLYSTGFHWLMFTAKSTIDMPPSKTAFSTVRSLIDAGSA